MADEKKWKIEGEPAIESGAELLELLADAGEPGDKDRGIPARPGLWVGKDICQIGWDLFTEEDEDGGLVDVPAKKVARAIFDHEYDGRVYVDDRHRDMVKQLVETGRYTAPLVKANPAFVEKSARVGKRLSKKSEPKPKAETKKDPAK